MHTFHASNGTKFHYNPDLSGEARIVSQVFNWRNGQDPELQKLAKIAGDCEFELHWQTPCRTSTWDNLSLETMLVLGATVSIDIAGLSIQIEQDALLIVARGDDPAAPIAHLRVDQIEGDTVWATVVKVFGE